MKLKCVWNLIIEESRSVGEHTTPLPNYLTGFNTSPTYSKFTLMVFLLLITVSEIVMSINFNLSYLCFKFSLFHCECLYNIFFLPPSILGCRYVYDKVAGMKLLPVKKLMELIKCSKSNCHIHKYNSSGKLQHGRFCFV